MSGDSTHHDVSPAPRIVTLTPRVAPTSGPVLAEKYIHAASANRKPRNITLKRVV